MYEKLLVLVTLVLLPQLSAGGTCSSQDVADSVDKRIRGTLANFTKTYAQIDELLAPVSTFLQASLMKQVLAEYGINPTNTTCKNNLLLERQLIQIRKAILRVELKNGQSIAQINKNLKQILQKLNMSADSNGYPPSSLLHSCEEIKTQYPNSLSDYYTIIDGTGHARHVYCEMGQVCGSSGWTRMAYLNMSDPTEECPSGFRLYSQNGVRACGRPVTSGGSCQSVRFPSYSISYSQVCGRVYGYQHSSTDAFESSDLNSYYVDGVSLTYGYPRKHLWTFVAGQQENFISSSTISDCPCATGSTETPPSIVGNDYFCESGCPGHFQFGTFYTDRLWDGQQCGEIERGCCRATGLPWFHKTLSTPTSDYIDLRVCCNQDTNDEDVSVGLYEIYVK